jgi:hypothetical protein
MIKLKNILNEAVKIQAKPNHWNTSDHIILVSPSPNKTYVLRFNNKNDSYPNSITFPTSMGTKPIDTNKAAREFWLKVKPDVVKWRSTNESVNEAKSIITEDVDTMYLVVALIGQLALAGQIGLAHFADYERRLGPIDSIKKWWKDRKDDKVIKSIVAKIKSDPEMIAFFKLSQNQQKGKFRKLIATKLSDNEIQYINRIKKSDLQQNESVNESTEVSDIIKDLDKVRTDLIKKVDVLIAKKKKLYSNVDIESPMSADEKQLDKDIQSIFSQIQQIIQQKRSIKEEIGNDTYDDYDELDVEDDDEEDFLNYLKGYKTELKEANCNCVYEAEYQGREVKLGKPMQGDVKKFKVYVKNPKTGKVIKVNFGQKGMVIKKDNPAARKSFRARMNCDSPGPRTKANYWSCRKW